MKCEYQGECQLKCFDETDCFVKGLYNQIYTLEKEMNAKVFLLMGEDLNFWKNLKAKNIRLEAENHALRQVVKDLNIIRLSEKYEQYKQALEEIRNLIIPCMAYMDGITVYKTLESIKNKINEVLNDEKAD